MRWQADVVEGNESIETHRLEEMLMTKNKQLETRLAEANRLIDARTTVSLRELLVSQR